MVPNLLIACVIALASWTQLLPTASASGPGFTEGHSSIESFIRASIQRFQIQEPLPGGYIQFTSNGRDLVNIYGSVNAHLASFSPIYELGVDVNLHWPGDGGTGSSQVKITMRTFGVVITGPHTVNGNVGHNLTLGGEGGNFTLIPPAGNFLKADCYMRASTSSDGHLQLGGCPSATGEISVEGGSVEFTRDLVNDTSLQADVNQVVVNQLENAWPIRLGSGLGRGLMEAIVNHVQRDLNATKVLDIISGVLPVTDATRNEFPEHVTGMKREREVGLINGKLGAFARSAISDFTSHHDPYFPDAPETPISYNKPVVSLDGHLSNVVFHGLNKNPALNVSACHDCSGFQLHMQLDADDCEVSGNFALNGTVSSQFPFQASGSFVLRGVGARFRSERRFSLTEGHFTPSTSTWWARSFDGGLDARFTPDILAGVDLSQQMREYVDEVVGWMIIEKLNTWDGYAHTLANEINGYLQAEFGVVPALDILR